MIQLQQAQQQSASQGGGIQIVQQIVTPNGDIQQIPVCRLYYSKKYARLINIYFIIIIHEYLYYYILIFIDTIDSATITNDKNASTRWK